MAKLKGIVYKGKELDVKVPFNSDYVYDISFFILYCVPIVSQANARSFN